MKSLNYDEKIGDIKNIKENNEEDKNNDDKNINNINNFNYGNNQYNNQGQNNNLIQNNYGGFGDESEEEILKRVLELSKNDYFNNPSIYLSKFFIL